MRDSRSRAWALPIHGLPSRSAVNKIQAMAVRIEKNGPKQVELGRKWISGAAIIAPFWRILPIAPATFQTGARQRMTRALKSSVCRHAQLLEESERSQRSQRSAKKLIEGIQ
jgi:hypothetical protein